MVLGDTAQAILFVGLLGILGLFFGLVILAFYNSISEKVKLILLSIAGLIFIAISFTAYQISINFLPNTFLGDMFYILWWVAMFGEVAYIFYMVVLLVIDVVTQKELTALADRGISD